MKKHLSTIILVVILLAGLSLLLYPTVSDWWNSFHQSQAIASYQDQVDSMSTADYDQMMADAHAYNERLWSKPNRFVMSDEERAEYEGLLNVSGTGMMGYVEVPKINCRLPIYHGMNEEVLQVAVGHLEGSSLPVGGEGTHSVLTAHRGLPSARLFTDLDQMMEGDIFLMRVLNETFTYEIDQIRIVEPEDVEELELVEGEDYCTLVTCTPYGVNSHRMLVRGHRIENLPEGLVDEDARQVRPTLVALCVGVPLILLWAIRILIVGGRKRSLKDVERMLEENPEDSAGAEPDQEKENR